MWHRRELNDTISALTELAQDDTQRELVKTLVKNVTELQRENEDLRRDLSHLEQKNLPKVYKTVKNRNS